MTRKTEDQWVADRMEAIRKLRKPSRSQAVMLELVGKPDLSVMDRRRFAAAIKAERASVTAAQAQARADAVFARSDTADRKRRDRCNFLIGSMAIDVARKDDAFRRFLIDSIETNIVAPRDQAALAPLLDDLRALSPPTREAGQEPPSKARKPRSRKPAGVGDEAAKEE